MGLSLCELFKLSHFVMYYNFSSEISAANTSSALKKLGGVLEVAEFLKSPTNSPILKDFAIEKLEKPIRSQSPNITKKLSSESKPLPLSLTPLLPLPAQRRADLPNQSARPGKPSEVKIQIQVETTNLLGSRSSYQHQYLYFVFF